jgi:FG-GAP-like repeat
MRLRLLLRTSGALALMALPALSGCLLLAGRHWEETRKTVIEPINAALHHHLPKDIKDKNLDAILAVYAVDHGSGVTWNDPVPVPGEFTEQRVRWQGPPASESIRSRYERLLALFATIDKAEMRIKRVYWDRLSAPPLSDSRAAGGSTRGFPADIRLIVRGLGPDGDRRTVDQHARVWLAQIHGGWALIGEEITGREMVSSTRPAFEVATAAAGIDDVHETDASPTFRLIGDTKASSGVAVADIDCDGFEDVALLSSSHLKIYRNNGNGTFTDVTVSTGLPDSFALAGTGLVFFDADNDGAPDLWVSGIYGDRFYHNEGCGTFVDATAEAAIRSSRWSSMAAVADYDRDGFLDVYVVRMGDHEHTAPTPNWEARNGIADTLYHNNGDGTFTDVSAAAGIHETGWGLAAAWGDYNNDGYPDLYVGNEFGTSTLYRNNGDGTFTNVSKESGAGDRGATMGVAWGDYNNDGYLDLYVSRMYANSRWALFHPDFPPPVPWYYSWVPRADIDAVTDQETRGSELLRNNGDGTFTDVSDQAGVRDTQWGWATQFLDYDNDGRLDIYSMNGFVSGPLLDDV